MRHITIIRTKDNSLKYLIKNKHTKHKKSYPTMITVIHQYYVLVKYGDLMKNKELHVYMNSEYLVAKIL